MQVWHPTRRRYMLAPTAKVRTHFPTACEEYRRVLRSSDEGTKVRLINTLTKNVHLSHTKGK